MRISPRYRKALYSLCFLTFLATLPLLSDALGIELFSLGVASTMSLSLMLLTLVTLGFAIKERFNIREFLRTSNVRWRYSKEEWAIVMQKLKEYYSGEPEFIFIFYTLVTVVLAMMLGILLLNIGAFFVMTGIGFVTSLGLAMISLLCNHHEYLEKKDLPQHSGLGEGEFFFNDIYFLENSRKNIFRQIVKSARLFKSGDSTFLKITTEEDTISWKGLGRIKQEYDILIPHGKVKDTKSIIDRIPSKA